MPAPAIPTGLHAWRLALAAFVLAAATGALMRFGALHGLPFGLAFDHVRHAHSHLMFFAWATPVVMLLAGHAVGAPRRFARVALAAALLGLLAYPPFLLDGYGSTALMGRELPLAMMAVLPFLLDGYGSTALMGRELPLAMMAAGLNGLAWLAFVGLYLGGTWGRSRDAALRAFDGAVALLLLAAAAAGTVGAVGIRGGGDATVTALVDLFLETFADGWFALGVLGLAYARAPRPRASRPAVAGIVLLPLALAVRASARAATALGVDGLATFASAAAFLAGVGLLLAVAPLLAREGVLGVGRWTLPLAFLAAKGGVEVALAFPAVDAWSEAASLRVLWLHAFLLGALTLGLAAAAVDRFGARAGVSPWLLAAGVLLLLAGLPPLTGAWPAAWGGPWALHGAAWSSLAPPLAIVISVPVVRASHGEDATPPA